MYMDEFILNMQYVLFALARQDQLIRCVCALVMINKKIYHIRPKNALFWMVFTA